MKTVYKNPLYNFIFDEDSILIFEWTEATAHMNDDDFCEALSNYAGFAFEYGGPGLLVDASKFMHKIGESAMHWRNEACLPRYLSAGSKKMAYVMPAAALSSLPPGEVIIGDFTDRYFGSREEASAWLLT